jgi:hypothetical protein
MPSREVTISDFSPGLMSNRDPADIPIGGAQVCQNYDTDLKRLDVCPGRTAWGRLPMTLTAGIRAISPFVVPDYVPESRMVAVVGTRLYWSVTGVVTTGTATAWATSQTFTAGQIRRPITANGYLYHCTTGGAGSTTTEPTWPTTENATVVDNAATWTCGALNETTFAEISSAVTVHATNPVRFQKFEQRLLIVDGSGYVLELAPDGTITTLTEFDAPTLPPDIDVTAIDTIVEWCDGNNARPGGQGIGYTAGWLYYKDGSIHPTNDINKSQWHVMNTSDDPADSDIDAIYARSSATNAFPGTTAGDVPAVTESMQLYIDYDSGSSEPIDCGDVRVARKRDVLSSTLSLRSQMDWSNATAATFSLYIDAGAPVPRPAAFNFRFGKDDDPATWQTVAVDISGALQDVWTEGTQRFTADLSGIANADKNEVYWICFEMLDLTLSPTSGGNARIIFSPITINTSTANFTPATYQFTYTYTNAAGEESSEYQDAGSFTQPYPVLVVNTSSIPQNITITCYLDSGNSATGVNLYVTGGAASVFQLVASVDFAAGETSVAIPWQGNYVTPTVLMPEYINKPPKAATMLWQWDNRIVYVARPRYRKWNATNTYYVNDVVIPTTANGYGYRVSAVTTGISGATEPASWGTTLGGTTADGGVTWKCEPLSAADMLYFSARGNPTKVKSLPSVLQITPSIYGGTADVEQVGHDVTAMKSVGPYLLVGKAQGVFVVSGVIGEDSFSVEKIEQIEGMASQESLVDAGNVLMWQGDGKILAWSPGNAVTSISDDVTDIVAAYSAAQQAACFAVYDPKRLTVQFTYPATGSAAVAPSSTALVFFLRTRGWGTRTAQPGACGCYAGDVATPGVYLADAYGASGRGKLFILDDAAITNAISFGAAVAIAPLWQSGEIEPSGAWEYADLTDLVAEVLVTDATGPFDLYAALLPSNDATYLLTRNLTVSYLRTYGSDATGRAEWGLAPHGEMRSCSVKVGRGTTYNHLQVRRLSLLFEGRGMVRGRSVTR